MGKIKSAIITAILLAAIVVLGFFVTVSYTVPKSNGVDRYNSFISSIHLGADLTGEATAVIYPEGVISVTDYKEGLPAKPEEGEDKYADKLEKYNKYINKYTQCGSVYVEKDLLEDEEKDLAESVKKDAAVLSSRFDKKGYSSYSVSVQDDYTIRIAVPTNFSYSAYKNLNASARSTETNKISRTIQYLTTTGELSVSSEKHNIPTKDNAADYFKSFTKYSAAKNYAVKINLTKEGKAGIYKLTSDMVADSETALNFYVGDTQILSLNNISEAIKSSFYIQVNNEALAEDYAIILNSAAKGETLSLNYGTSDDLTINYASAALGDNAAIYLFVSLLVLAVGAIVYSIVRYRKLGLVNAIMILIYSLAMMTAILLIEIQLTVTGAFMIILGLALLCGSNFVAFEAIRGETKRGKTMHAAIKSGYRSRLTAILDLHVIMIIVSLMTTLICMFTCAGEIFACAFIFFIASFSSYILYWFTRFMWYVLSSPAKDKFAFCGFKREVPLDD
ncbi:MAG: hypothetical protein K2N22_00240 [Clostridia bacterium]|nr:hypothetical protein [Clostridia bacterium]